MKNYRQRGKSIKSESKLSGYELGSGIRQAVKERAQITGNALNSLQHKIGIRTTSVLIGLIWLAAFYYFANLLLPFI